MSDITALRQALATLEEFVREVEGNSEIGGDGPAERPDESAVALTCTPKALPSRLLAAAAANAIQINPVNAPLVGPVAQMGSEAPNLEIGLLTVLTAKYWGPAPRVLTVSFMESTPADLRNRILSHMNAWSTRCGISFRYTQGVGNVRISRSTSGYWSYLGTDIGLIPTNRPTMSLQAFTMNTPESEYKRVVRHETGHTMGFPHEHMRRQLVARIDPQKAYEYFRRTQGWDRTTVDQQVLTALDDRTIMGTPADQMSIMCYQLPGSITRDGRPILGGNDINATDFAFAARIYPRQAFDLGTHLQMQVVEEDWPESEDVQLAT